MPNDSILYASMSNTKYRTLTELRTVNAGSQEYSTQEYSITKTIHVTKNRTPPPQKPTMRSFTWWEEWMEINGTVSVLFNEGG